MIEKCSECGWFQPRMSHKSGLCIYKGAGKGIFIKDRNQKCKIGQFKKGIQ